MQNKPAYMSLKDAADYLGIKRPSIYYYIRELNLERKRFPHNKNTFLHTSDVEKIKGIKDRPWEGEQSQDI